MSDKKPYNAFSDWLIKRYGCRVRKVSLTTSLGCPNRDGTLGTEGCFFCDEHMGGFADREMAALPVGKQLEKQIARLEEKAKKPQKYLAYLQAGSNTHGSIHQLHSLYQQVMNHTKVISVAIGTRPDCVSEERLDLIKVSFEGKDVWIELGVQTSNEKTLQKIGRNHSFSDTTRAMNLIKKQGFLICAHLILGLPGEDGEDMLETVEAMNRFGIHGVKFHPLSITRGARYARDWPQLPFPLLEEDQYVDLVVKLLARLSPDIVIQRLVGGGRPEVHLAPDWAMQPSRIIQKIRKRMDELNIKQTT